MVLVFLVACISPTQFGAVADDDRSDTVAFQRAVDEAITKTTNVCVGPGVWHLTRTKGQLGSLMITAGPLEIRGQGRRTVLRMTGDGNQGHWGMIQLRGAQRVVLCDLTIDGLAAYNTEEQTHLVEIGPDSKDIVLFNVTLGPMRKPSEPVGAGIGGDCIRLLGNPGHEVERVVISHSTFVDCDRSAIGLQRSLRKIVIASIKVRGTGDTPIDFEPTGAGAIEDVVMIGLDIERAPKGQGAWSVTIGGIGVDLARRVVLTKSRLGAGGVGMINVADVEITDNVMTHHAGVEGVISIMRRGSRIRVANNTIVRPASTPAGPLVRATHNNGYSPDRLLVEHNTLRQETSAPIIYSASARSMIVRDNSMEYSGSDPRMGIVVAEARTVDVDELRILDNKIRGGHSILIAGARNHHFGEVEVQRNTTDQNLNPIKCDGTAAAFRAVTIDSDLKPKNGCEKMRLTRARARPTPNP